MSLKFNLHDCKKLTYNGKPVSKGYIDGKIFYTSRFKNILSNSVYTTSSEKEFYVYTSEDLVNWYKYDFDFYISSITNIGDVFFANKLKKVNDRYEIDKLIISSNAIDWNDANEFYSGICDVYTLKYHYCGKLSNGYNYFNLSPRGLQSGIYKTLDFINFEYCSTGIGQCIVFNDKLIGSRKIGQTTQVVYSDNGVDWTTILSMTDSNSGSVYNYYHISSIKVEKDICYFMMSYTKTKHDVKTKYCDNTIYVSRDGVNFNNVLTYTSNLPYDAAQPDEAIPYIKIFYSNHFYHIGCETLVYYPSVTYRYKFYYSVDLTNFIEIQSLSNEMNQHRWFPSDMFFANSKWHLFFVDSESRTDYKAEFISSDGFTWNKSDNEKYLIGNVGNKIFFADSVYGEGANNISITENFEDYNYCNFDIKPEYSYSNNIIII